MPAAAIDATAGLTRLDALVTRAAAAHGDRTAFVSGPDRMTWAEVETAVATEAAALSAAGLRPGDRVALVLPNTLDFPVRLFAVLRCDLVAVPVNTGYTPRELRHVLSDSGAAALITGADGAALVAEIAADLPDLRLVRRVDRPAEDHRAAGGLPAHLVPTSDPGGDAEDLALVVYTSGTSGAPRGAMLSHRAVLANLEQIAALEPTPITATDVVLLVLPLFHIYGFTVGLGMAARAGAAAVLLDRFEPSGCLEVMAAEAVSTVIGAPPMYLAWSVTEPSLLARGFAGVRTALSGAAPLPPSAREAIRAATGVLVHEGYGLTETAPVLTSTLAGDSVKPGSVGRALPGIEIRLRDAAGIDGDGEDIDADETASDTEDATGDEATGEIWARGKNLFSGYWPDGRDGPDAEGWLRTGDIGFLDTDGDLHLVDRVSDLILVSGFNVYPAEVETVLMSHPGVRDCAVVGVPDALTGEAVRALVVLDRDPDAGEDADDAPGEAVGTAELTAHCRRNLARFKCPSSVSVVATLPHSVTGKVSRARLRELGLA
ncbi:MAG: AMP-binding protein [Geodermatophilaceae bacterium]|nr:AMP-binding protein [Geodermatophilaceae bacterium]